MSATSAVISVAILVASFILAMASFYIISDETKQTKKTYIEEVLSFVTNFIILIWIGKIVFNVSTFIKDPIVVLAYPSHSSAFYFAFVISLLLVVRKVIQKKVQLALFSYTTIGIVLLASFFYEFMDLVWQDNTYGWRYLTLLVTLTIIFVVLNTYLSKQLLSGLILIIWGTGQWLLAMTLPFTTVFGYLISPWFFVVLMIIGVVLMFINNRKQVTS
ncbi:hypothetical protein [Aquisalibacillus elongatus]|uniref:Uncharacterized protein n=1 Tax=Aquisalibacillus elongatus TaxID=485577 RepID=A0A3N5CF35_9BACI|nr:hypothetical protein [Aquisalibacillus elongatus]RPF55901.1 hypothetical protein EDC24_0787 [Aquisalibacillus elongatus]